MSTPEFPVVELNVEEQSPLVIGRSISEVDGVSLQI